MDEEKAKRVAIAVRMRDLIQHPAWGTYQRELSEMEARFVERCVNGTKDEFDLTRGIIEGLRRAKNLPEQLLQNVV